MCGILAVISEDNEPNEYYEKMQQKLLHRGPDYQSKYKEKSYNSIITLIHNRLVIRELSELGNQPYRYKEFILIFNGEIYNTDELIKNLNDINIKIESNCDTEVLCKYIAHYGITSIQNIRGMYSLCFYNKKTKIIIATRDQLGIKPLYYKYSSKKIIISSEALVFDKDLINQQAFESYMVFGYFPKEETLLEDVHKFQPGEIHIINTQSFKVSKFFIQLDFKKNKISNINESIGNILESSIKEQLVADVPVGIFLSGGIDSSIIAYHTKKNIGKFNSYVSKYYGDDSEKFNIDYEYAKLVAKDLKINLIDVEINPNKNSFANEFLDWASRLDQPQANLTGYTSYLLFKKAKDDGIKVILTGDGSDEIFGGYSRYSYALLLERYKLLRFIPKYSKFYSSNKLLKYGRATGFVNTKLLKKLCLHDFKFREYKDENFFKNDFEIANLINLFDLKIWLSEESNMRIDRSSMLNSIEARVPFQDKNIVENFFKIPLRTKFGDIGKYNSNNYSKKQLRDYAKEILPQSVVTRKKKGWDAPDSKWFRSGLKELAEYYILDYDSGFFNRTKISKLFYSHINKKSYQRDIIRRILMFNIWHYHQYKLGSK